jgi:hypothetical protein
MPDTSPTPGREGSLCDSAPGAWPHNRECEPLPRGWIANLIKREFLLWNIVMIKLEDPKNGVRQSNDADSRAKDVRVLAQLRRSLGELMKYEAARDELRTTKMTASHDEMLQELERRLDKLSAAGEGKPSQDGDDR